MNKEKGCGKTKKVKCGDGEIISFTCPDDHLCNECSAKSGSAKEESK